MPQNASFYIADPSMLGARLLNGIPDIQSYEGLSSGDTATGMRLKLPWGSITMNFMPPGNLSEHLKGFEGYMHHVISDRDTLIYALARLRYVQMSIGCVIEHDESDTDEVHSFLFSFNKVLNGLLFLYDSIFDYSGEALGGPAADNQ